MDTSTSRIKKQKVIKTTCPPNRGADMTDEGAMRLAAAILGYHYKDYAKVLKKITIEKQKKNPTIEDRNHFIKLLKLKEQYERFYYSSWFETLTLGMAASPKDVVETIQKKVGFKE